MLEADPTTATAVAAVQSDVDQNEADADAALALKAPLADPDFTGQRLRKSTSMLRLEYDSNLTKMPQRPAWNVNRDLATTSR